MISRGEISRGDMHKQTGVAFNSTGALHDAVSPSLAVDAVSEIVVGIMPESISDKWTRVAGSFSESARILDSASWRRSGASEGWPK